MDKSFRDFVIPYFQNLKNISVVKKSLKLVSMKYRKSLRLIDNHSTIIRKVIFSNLETYKFGDFQFGDFQTWRFSTWRFSPKGDFHNNLPNSVTLGLATRRSFVNDIVRLYEELMVKEFKCGI